MTRNKTWVPAAPGLGATEVHVWFIKELSRIACVDLLRGLLSEKERQAALSHCFATDQVRYVTCHGLLRLLLSAYVPAGAGSLQFSCSEFGKPAIAALTSTVAFNMSHSGDSVVYAVTRDGRVGIDIEQAREVPDAEQIIHHFFSPRECGEFQRLKPSLKPAGFLSCWTRKEALCKAVGAGLSLGLDAFDVSVDPEVPGRLVDVRADMLRDASWFIADLRLPVGVVGAVALDRPAEVVCRELSCSRSGELLYASDTVSPVLDAEGSTGQASPSVRPTRDS